MMRKLPWFLLAISIALNISAVAGFLYSEQEAERLADPATQLAQVAEELSLTPEQFEEFKALSANRQERRRMFREYMAPVRRAMTEAMVSETFEREDFRRVVTKRGEVRDEYFLQIGEELHDFFQSLSPEQKATFQELSRSRGYLWRFMGGRPRPKTASTQR